VLKKLVLTNYPPKITSKILYQIFLPYKWVWLWPSGQKAESLRTNVQTGSRRNAGAKEHSRNYVRSFGKYDEKYNPI